MSLKHVFVVKMNLSCYVFVLVHKVQVMFVVLLHSCAGDSQAKIYSNI